MNYNVRFHPQEFASLEEEMQAAVFTTAQSKYLENIMIDIMNERAQIAADSSDPHKVNYQLEFARGQISILQGLLLASEQTIATINQVSEG